MNEEKTTNDQILIKRIKEIEEKFSKTDNPVELELKEHVSNLKKLVDQGKKDLSTAKKEAGCLIKKNKKLEETLKQGYQELDKQLQLKEKYAEEKKLLKEIINTDKQLRGS